MEMNDDSEETRRGLPSFIKSFLGFLTLLWLLFKNYKFLGKPAPLLWNIVGKS